VIGAAAIPVAGASHARDPVVTLISNVNVCDGSSETLIEDAHLVITSNLITAVSADPLAVAGGRAIDGGGRGVECSSLARSPCRRGDR
jgi:hypothetical protein